MKRCARCKEVKDLDCFGIALAHNDMRQYTCKACRKKRAQTVDRDRRILYMRAWRKKRKALSHKLSN